MSRDAAPLEPVLRQVVDELHASQPDRLVETVISLNRPVDCDRARIAQLFSNLLGNALTYGSPDQPIRVRRLAIREPSSSPSPMRESQYLPRLLIISSIRFIAARRTRIEKAWA